MLVDWMGDTLKIVACAITGETSEAHFFVGTLGFSGLPYVEAFADEKQHSRQQGHINAFNYYGGTALILVPDYCKTAGTKPSHYEPAINGQDMALLKLKPAQNVTLAYENVRGAAYYLFQAGYTSPTIFHIV